MILKEFLEVVNYNVFDICVKQNSVLKSIFKITAETPVKYISDELLNAEIVLVVIYDKNDGEDSLFTIEVELNKSNIT